MGAKVVIDEGSGFCFGVVNAIRKAEEVLDSDGILYCLGDIVHNSEEVERLRKKGLVTITHDELETLHDVKVLLRAHGEPPATYRIAERNNIEIIDATCPVVLRLQKRIKESYTAGKKPAQIVIYGKNGHAEVNGLVGQTEGNAIVIERVEDLQKLDFSKPVTLYSQTTKSPEGFLEIVRKIDDQMNQGAEFKYHDTICRQVAGRVEGLRKFASAYDVVIFVSGAKSSNGKVLFEECRKVNPQTYLVQDIDSLEPQWFRNVNRVGVCGATSTPRWLMERVASAIGDLVEKA